MFNFSLKNKMLLLAVLPMATVVLLLMLLIYSQMRAMGEQEVTQFRADMMQEKQDALEHHVAIAVSAVAPYMTGNSLDAAQLEAAKAVIRAWMSLALSIPTATTSKPLAAACVLNSSKVATSLASPGL